NRNGNKVDRFVGSYSLEYKPLDWITISNNLGGDIYAEKRSSVTRKGTAGATNGKFTNYNQLYRQINNDLIASLERNDLIQDFKFKLLLGHNINEREVQTDNVEAGDITIDQLYNYT